MAEAIILTTPRKEPQNHHHHEQMCIENLLCARCCSRHWDYSSEQRPLPSWNIYSMAALVEESTRSDSPD